MRSINLSARSLSEVAWYGFAALLLLPLPSSAEPYIAVAAGLKCAQCHVNPSGGGKRTLFGMVYARTQIASQQILSGPESQGWNSQVTDWLGLGGDLRGGYTEDNVPGRADTSDFAVTKGTVYAEFRAVPNLLTFYFDQKISPDNSENREAYALVTPQNGKYTLKVGQFFLPFGLRLQDDTAFVRQRSGINYLTPDDGVELGLELPKWSAQVAVTNGTAGEGSAPGKDQYSLSAAYVLPRWRVGASVNLNDDPLGDREMLGLFAGWRTGPISWLAELDFIEDQNLNGPDTDIYASLLEGNWRIRQGQNLKLTYEFVDPSDRQGEDELERYSLVWEYSPIQLLQARVGFRAYNGVPQVPSSNRDHLFVEAHVYF
jgi:hypothetical protein